MDWPFVFRVLFAPTIILLSGLLVAAFSHASTALFRPLTRIQRAAPRQDLARTAATGGRRARMSSARPGRRGARR